MAKRKKTATKSSAVWIVSVLVVLFLGVLGIQIPDDWQQLLGIDEPKTEVVKGNNPGPIELGQAAFTSDELKSGQGWIKYHALDSLGRATGADALLTKKMINTGTSANSEIRPPGFVSGKAPYNHSRGHLIGRQMGGSGDDPRNLTTLYQNPVNTPYMTKYENMIRQALEDGQTVRYRVTPVYEGSQLLCTKIVMEARSLGKNPEVNFHVEILNEQ